LEEKTAALSAAIMPKPMLRAAGLANKGIELEAQENIEKSRADGKDEKDATRGETRTAWCPVSKLQGGMTRVSKRGGVPDDTPRVRAGHQPAALLASHLLGPETALGAAAGTGGAVGR